MIIRYLDPWGYKVLIMGIKAPLPPRRPTPLSVPSAVPAAPGRSARGLEGKKLPIIGLVMT